MAIGPVQLIVLGFNHPNFHGEIIEELERLRASDTVRVIDSLVVYKDAEGEIEVEHLSNLSPTRRSNSGSKVGALIGLGIEGEEGIEAGAELGAEAAAEGFQGLRRGRVGRPGGNPERLRRRSVPARTSLGGSAARRHRPNRRVPDQRRVHQPARPRRDRASVGRRGQASCTPWRSQRPGTITTRITTWRIDMFGSRRVARRTSRRTARRVSRRR